MGGVFAAMDGHFWTGLLVHLVRCVVVMLGVVRVCVVANVLTVLLCDMCTLVRWHLGQRMVIVVVLRMLLALIMLFHSFVPFHPHWGGTTISSITLYAVQRHRHNQPYSTPALRMRSLPRGRKRRSSGRKRRCVYLIRPHPWPFSERRPPMYIGHDERVTCAKDVVIKSGTIA
jgi:hypothetical protein